MICYTSRQVPLLQIFSYQNASQVAVSLPGLQIQGWPFHKDPSFGMKIGQNNGEMHQKTIENQQFTFHLPICPCLFLFSCWKSSISHVTSNCLLAKSTFTLPHWSLQFCSCLFTPRRMWRPSLSGRGKLVNSKYHFHWFNQHFSAEKPRVFSHVAL